MTGALIRTLLWKVFNRDAVAIEQRRRLREVGIHGSVDHRGVVALLGSGTEAGRMYLVMEFVAGENLAQRLLGGPLDGSAATARPKDDPVNVNWADNWLHGITALAGASRSARRTQ